MDTKKINVRTTSYLHQLQTFHTAILLYKKRIAATNPECLHNDEEVKICETAVAARFEYCVEGFWKFLKRYHEEKGIQLKETSPKFIIRTAGLYRFITEKETTQLLSMIDERNKASHMYCEEIIHHIVAVAPQYHEILDKITQRLT